MTPRRETDRNLTQQALREVVRGAVVDLLQDASSPEPEPVADVDPGLITPPWRTALGAAEPLRITRPGLYQMTAEEYHDPAVTGAWLSNSDGKKLTGKGCPAQFKYDRDHGIRERSEAFTFGHLVHALILGKGEEIAVRPDTWDSWRTNASKAWRDEQEAAGREVVLPDEYARAVEMAEAVHEDAWAHRLLTQPGRPEVGMFWYDPETGVPRRALVDYLPSVVDADGVMSVVDYKTAESVAPDDDMDRNIWKYGYNRQAAALTDGIRALGLAESVQVYFIMQAKHAPYLVTVVQCDTRSLQIGQIDNREAQDVFQECMETGVWPKFTDRPVTRSLPWFVEQQYEDEMVIS